MLIECHECKARVDAEEVGYIEVDEGFWSQRTYLLKCPACNNPLIGECEDDIRKEEFPWTELVRVYPKPPMRLSPTVPGPVKKSLREADKCLQIGAHIAAAAMAGRALEAICRHYSTEDTYLGAGIKELKEKGIIDSRLYEWSEELRDQRNAAAHATNTEISSQDAEDIVTLTYAIVDYVFMLTTKFENFKKRKADEKKNKKK